MNVLADFDQFTHSFSQSLSDTICKDDLKNNSKKEYEFQSPSFDFSGSTPNCSINETSKLLLDESVSFGSLKDDGLFPGQSPLFKCCPSQFPKIRFTL